MKWIKLGQRYYCFGFNSYTNRLGTTVTIGFGLGIITLYDCGLTSFYDAIVDGMDIAFWPRKNIVEGDLSFTYNKEWHFRKVTMKYIYSNRRFYGV